jgi:hypothetical protein
MTLDLSFINRILLQTLQADSKIFLIQVYSRGHIFKIQYLKVEFTQGRKEKFRKRTRFLGAFPSLSFLLTSEDLKYLNHTLVVRYG